MNMTVKEFMAQAVPMDAARKRDLGWSLHRYVPMFICRDGIVCPVKDTGANSPGTFGGLEDESAIFTLKPEIVREKS